MFIPIISGLWDDREMAFGTHEGVSQNFLKKILKRCLTNRDNHVKLSKHSRERTEHRGVEQLEARRAHNPEVVGSSPASATIKIPGIRYEYRGFSYFYT